MKLTEKSEAFGVDLDSIEFAQAMDKTDTVGYLRNKFHYPKMGDLPHGEDSFINFIC